MRTCISSLYPTSSEQQHNSPNLVCYWIIVLQVSPGVGGPVGVRKASGSFRFDSDGSGRLVTWDSFGIWDNRIEEPILLPSSIKYGKPIPQVTGWMNEHMYEQMDDGWIDESTLSLRSVCPGLAVRLFWASGSRTKIVSVSPVSMTTCCTSPCSTATAAR